MSWSKSNLAKSQWPSSQLDLDGKHIEVPQLSITRIKRFWLQLISNEKEGSPYHKYESKRIDT